MRRHKRFSSPNICPIAPLPSNVASAVLSAPLQLSGGLLAGVSSPAERSLVRLERCLLGPKTVLYPAGAQYIRVARTNGRVSPRPSCFLTLPFPSATSPCQDYPSLYALVQCPWKKMNIPVIFLKYFCQGSWIRGQSFPGCSLRTVLQDSLFRSG